jgi:2-keto-4-pentenoate hydratase/2-oxohepta-3-ene-1,7-dioic acid hydratase in catechol pathway
LVVDGGIVDISRRIANGPRTMIELITQWPQLRSAVAALAGVGKDIAFSAARLHSPIVRPSKVLAIGLNYADHCAEAKLEVPKYPTWFCKAPSSVTGPHDLIELPRCSDQLDHEAEMVFVIGRRARNLPKERAREVIFGYCVGDDVSVRDWQLRTSQWFLGKSFDTHAPIGPWLTTADEVGDPHQLDIRLLVNGLVRQHSNTRNLIFDCFDQVAHLSTVMTLEPGDVVFTGTCAGVGAAAEPQRWLRKGDTVRVEIERLGAIENRVEPASETTVLV